jgi:hypothetical protein
MSNGDAPQDPDHTKKVQEFARVKELAEAEKATLDAEKNRLEAQQALAAQKASAADDELKAKTAAATAAKALADAEKASIDAKRALDRARKPLDAADEAREAKAATAKAERELSDAQKVAADAAKAQADASKAKADAEVAAFKARFGEVPASRYSGDVTLKDNPGKTEALLLAAQAARSAAAAIAKAIKDKATKVMLIASPDVPTFDNLMRFRVELGIVQKAFEEMDRISTEAHDKEPAARAAPAAVRAARVPQPARGVAPVAAAGLALDAADKLLGFFRTDYTVGGIDVTLEDAMLINELAGLLTEGGMTVYLPKVFNGNELTQTASAVVGELQGMAQCRASSTAIATEHQRLVAVWNERAGKEADVDKKAEMTATAESHQRASDAVGKANALYDSWFSKLSSLDEKSSLVPIVSVIRERALMSALDGGRSLLAVKLHASGGSYYTKKNIWTVLGAMPFFHMGGTVTSYALIDGQTGEVKRAGTLPVHGGFFKASKLPNQLVDQPGPPRERSWWRT